MSSFIISKNTNNKTSTQDFSEPEELLNQGVEKIYQSFGRYKEKIDEQENIIKSITKKIEMLNEELGMIQRENQYYKTQNEQQKKEIERLNKMVQNIKGKLTSVDFHINECIKTDNVKFLNYKKNYEPTRRKKNSSLFIGLKSKNNDQSLFQLKPKNCLNDKNENYVNKNTKNKKLSSYINNKNLNDTFNNQEAYDNNGTVFDNFKKKFNQAIEYNSFELNMNNNNNNNANNNNNTNNNKNNHNSVLHKNIITREDKKKKNNDKSEEKEFENFISNMKNKKNRSYSSKVFPKDNNKTSDDIIINSTNDDDLDFNKVITNDKGYEDQICYTYDNVLNKHKSRKQNSHNSFRGELIKTSAENILKHYNPKKHKNFSIDIVEKNNHKEKYQETIKEELKYFFRKCEITLDKESFEAIVKLFQEYREGLITDEGMILKIKNHLNDKKELIDLFNNIFS